MAPQVASLWQLTELEANLGGVFVASMQNVLQDSWEATGIDQKG